MCKELLCDQKRYLSVLLRIIAPFLPENHPREIAERIDAESNGKDLIIEVCYREVLVAGLIKTDWHTISQVPALNEKLWSLQPKFQDFVKGHLVPTSLAWLIPTAPLVFPKALVYPEEKGHTQDLTLAITTLCTHQFLIEIA